MKAFLVLLTVYNLTIVHKLFGQNQFPPAYTLTTDTVSVITLPDSNWQLLNDKVGNETIASVRQSSVSDRFRDRTDTIWKDNQRIFTFWIRFRLKNATPHDISIFLKFASARQSDLYLFDTNGTARRIVGGTMIPWSQHDPYKRKSLTAGEFVPLTLSAGDELLVYRSATSFLGAQPSSFAVRLYSQKYVLNEEDTLYLNAIKSSFYFGVLFWVAILNILFFCIVKERAYLYFSLYVFFLGLARFDLEKAGFQLFFREHPNWYSWINTYYPTLIPLALTFFVRSFFRTYVHYPCWDKVLTWVSVFHFVFGICCFTIIRTISPSSMRTLLFDLPWAFSIVVYGLLLVTLFLLVRSPEKQIRSILLVFIPAFGTWTVWWSFTNISAYLNRWFGLPFSAFYAPMAANWQTVELSCLYVIVFYFSWILLQRFSELRKQVLQKELEKEVERRQLIAQQNELLEQQVAERTAELKHSLNNLRTTQTQLIQREKMASLGELTAGIAHEIQNPLNFVNNFSELSTELVDELTEEAQAGRIDEVLAIAGDLTQNLQKVTHHGQRASSIVKGMLEHSRTSSGQKEPTDLNVLADEYLRLAYQGQRSKDQTLTCQLVTDFTPDLPLVDILPQEIGRVLLNLYNNAFYTVAERQKTAPPAYQPTIWARTAQVDGSVQIRVKDNGTGIPESVKAKIFQPFFTTKPTGEGTGLGLSLSYDIVIKGHGGTLEVESVEGEGPEFIITIPLAKPV
jgi:two-component system NtrC family sensor kinase